MRATESHMDVDTQFLAEVEQVMGRKFHEDESTRYALELRDEYQMTAESVAAEFIECDHFLQNCQLIK